MSIETVRAVIDDLSQDCPKHVSLQIASKHVSNLRVCLTGSFLGRLIGPTLPPHLIPDISCPPPRSTDGEITVRYDLPNLEDDIPNDKTIFITKSAFIGTELSHAMIDLDMSAKVLSFPQQPFAIQLGPIRIDCSIEPSRVYLDVPIKRLYVHRNTYGFQARTDKFYVAVASEDHSSYDYKSNRSRYVINHSARAFAYRSNELNSAYSDDPIPPTLSSRYWLVWEYDKEPVNEIVRDSSTYFGPYMLISGTPFKCQSRNIVALFN